MMYRSLPYRVLLILIAFTMAGVPVSIAAERDPLASVVNMESPQLQTVPRDIFTSAQRDSISSVVNEARLFGVPLVVRVISVPAPLGSLYESGAIAGAAPSAGKLTERLAEQWLAEEGVETSPGAEDGILLLVVVPEGNHRLTTAAFATGNNALPLNGLTRGRLDNVVTDIMQPFFADNSIGAGIHSGIAHLSYDNLFAVPARLQRTEQQEKLRDLTNIVPVGITALGVAALGGLILWIRRRDHTRVAVPDDDSLSPFEAGALTRGRVDEPVVTAALLYLINCGAIDARIQRSGALMLSVNSNVTVADPFAQEVAHRLAIEAGQDGRLPDAAVRRLQDILAPAREWLQDHLAARHLFNRDARVETVWITLGSAALGALALLTLVPSMVAMSRLGVFAVVIAMLAVAVALTWVARRPWTTRAGEQMLRIWLSSALDPESRRIYETIVHQDALLQAPGGPDTPVPVRMVRELRALGTG